MRGRLLLLTLAVALVLSFAPSAASPACPGVDGFFCRRAVIPAPDIDFFRAADLDAAGGDGDLDFVAVASGQDDVFWYENDGQAFAGYQKRLHQHAITLSSNGVTTADAGDADGDGDLDVYTLSAGQQQLVLWENRLADGKGFTRASSRGLAGQYSQVETADLDGDGFDDLVLVEGAGGPGGIDWWRNPGGSDAGNLLKYGRQVVVGQSRISRLHVADLDGDGLLDFLGAMGEGDADELRWWRQERVDPQKPPLFAARPVIARLDDLMDAAAADLNHDGRIDVLALTMRAVGGGAARSRVQLLAGRGDGSFDPALLAQDSGVNRVNDGMWTALDVGDINNDGGIDFVAAEPVERGVLCWYENPAPALLPSPSSTLPPSPSPTPEAPTAVSTTASTATPPRLIPSATPEIVASASAGSPRPSATLTRPAPSETATSASQGTLPAPGVPLRLALPWLGARGR